MYGDGMNNGRGMCIIVLCRGLWLDIYIPSLNGPITGNQGVFNYNLAGFLNEFSWGCKLAYRQVSNIRRTLVAN